VDDQSLPRVDQSLAPVAESLARVARLAAVTEAAGVSSAALVAAAAQARVGPAGSAGSCAVLLVEGMSDQSALVTLAGSRGRDLSGEGVFVVPMGGATNIGHFLEVFGPRGFGVRLGRSPPSAAAWNGPAWQPARAGPAWNDSVSSPA
jgi:hypothetical protein